jgi:hypothetical protein
MENIPEKKRFKLDCTVPVSTLIYESFFFIILVSVTFGIALPFCLFRLGKVLVENTELTEE